MIKSRSKQLLSKVRLPKRVSPLAIVLFVLVATALILLTRAASGVISFEAESGTVSGNATKVNESGASGGMAVIFRPTSPTPPPPSPPNNFNPGNPNGNAPIPAGMNLEDVSNPNHVIGNGTASSCTSAAFLAAVNAGGIIKFNCGPNPLTITLTDTARVRNSIPKLVIDGGGLVTLSGGGVRRILYTDTCDESLGSVSGNCLYAPTGPQVTVQNITFADGNATNAPYVQPGDNGDLGGGGAIFQLGGRLKVVKSIFVRNRCNEFGADHGGAAIRVLAQNSPTPDSLDSAFAAFNQYPVAIVQSTFGGSAGQGGNCSNGGAYSSLRTPATFINNLISHNSATGCCANPAEPGTIGGGSGGAIYTDGNSYDLNIAGTIIENNTARAGGRAIFYVSNDHSGRLSFTNSIIRNNSWVPNGGYPQFEFYPGIFYLGNGEPNFSGSSLQ